MISSVLVEPLISGFASRRRSTALRRSSLATTALALSALLATTATPAHAAKVIDAAQAELAKPNAHQRPAAPPAKEIYRAFVALVAERADEDVVRDPGEAPNFGELEALLARHDRDRSIDPGPRLRVSRARGRLRRDERQTFWLFGSARHLSAFAAA